MDIVHASRANKQAAAVYHLHHPASKRCFSAISRDIYRSGRYAMAVAVIGTQLQVGS